MRKASNHISDSELLAIASEPDQISEYLQNHLQQCLYCSERFAIAHSIRNDSLTGSAKPLSAQIHNALQRRSRSKVARMFLAALIPLVLFIGVGFYLLQSQSPKHLTAELVRQIGQCTQEQAQIDTITIKSGPYSICEVNVANSFNVRLFGAGSITLSNRLGELNDPESGTIAVHRYRDIPLSFRFAGGAVTLAGTKVLLQPLSNSIEILEGEVTITRSNGDRFTLQEGEHFDVSNGTGRITEKRIVNLGQYFQLLPENPTSADYAQFVRTYFADEVAGVQTVVLKSGEQITGAISDNGGQIVVTNQNGVRRFKVTQVDRILFR